MSTICILTGTICIHSFRSAACLYKYSKPESHKAALDYFQAWTTPIENDLKKMGQSRDLGCLKTRSDQECSSPAFSKYTGCKNTTGNKRKPLTMFLFCPYCLKFLQQYSLDAEL